MDLYGSKKLEIVEIEGLSFENEALEVGGVAKITVLVRIPLYFLCILLADPLEAAGLGSRVVVPNSDFSSRDFDRIPRWNLDVPRFKSMRNIPQALGNASEPSGNAGSAAFLIPAL